MVYDIMVAAKVQQSRDTHHVQSLQNIRFSRLKTSLFTHFFPVLTQTSSNPNNTPSFFRNFLQKITHFSINFDLTTSPPPNPQKKKHKVQGGPLPVINGFIIPSMAKNKWVNGVISPPISGVMGPYLKLVGGPPCSYIEFLEIFQIPPCFQQLVILPETNILHLKMGAPRKRRFLLETMNFRGCVSFREGTRVSMEVSN